MRLTMTVDQRYWRTPDGATWTRMPPDFSFFSRHLHVFNRVQVVARTVMVSAPPDGATRADGPDVVFRAMRNYAGPGEFVRHSAGIGWALRSVVGVDDAVLLRVPSQLANWLTIAGRPEAFGVEVLGDPSTLYRQPFYRKWFTGMLRRQCSLALNAAYVSKELAERYPAKQSHQVLDIDLPENAFSIAPRRLSGRSPKRILTVGGFDYDVKGHDVLIDAVAEVGGAVLTIVGGGRLRDELAARARRLGVAVHFAGELGGAAAVREYFASADLFVLASRSEGKPRALIEAMAAGVPALGSAVGGIAELLPAHQLCPAGCSRTLATRIRQFLSNQEQYRIASEQGVVTAREYSNDFQSSRRKVFLEELCELTRFTQKSRAITTSNSVSAKTHSI